MRKMANLVSGCRDQRKWTEAKGLHVEMMNEDLVEE